MGLISLQVTIGYNSCMPWPPSDEQQRLIDESAKISREAWTAGILSLPSLVIALGADQIADGAINNGEAILNIWIAFILINALVCGYRQYQLFKDQ